MSQKLNYKWMMILLAIGFFCAGSFNALVINSDSLISSSDISYPKRLDEILGIKVEGRQLAGEVHWKKLPQKTIQEKSPDISVTSEDKLPEIEGLPEETQEINVGLVEVTNQNKWKKGLADSQFNGTLTSHDGVIEHLNVNLPEGETITVSFAELSGNVFQYDLNGNLYSGMMYQVDQKSYMVTLTNGPLEGTRLRFSSQKQESEVAENSFEVQPEISDSEYTFNMETHGAAL